MSTAATDDAPKANNKILTIALWVVQVMLALAFMMAGAMKMMTAPDALVEQGMAWAGRLPAWTVPTIGALEVLAAIGLILPAALRIAPKLTAFAAAGLVLTMLVAAAEHGMAGEFGAIVPNLVLGGLAAFVMLGRLLWAPIRPRG